MGEANGCLAVETEHIHEVAEHAELLAVQAAVHPDGADARITLHTSEGMIQLTIPFDRISAAHAEIRHASILMLYRQTLPVERSHNPLNDLLLTAMEPSRVSVVVDQSTGDRLFIQQFVDRMPIVTRMSVEAVNRTFEEVVRASRNAAN